jgi:hypothetical protein
MMSLSEVLAVIEQLSGDERQELQNYLSHQQKAPLYHPTNVDEWIEQMKGVSQMIREGFSDEEWEEMEAQMNAEHLLTD